MFQDRLNVIATKVNENRDRIERLEVQWNRIEDQRDWIERLEEQRDPIDQLEEQLRQLQQSTSELRSDGEDDEKDADIQDLL
jgi:hypothetical protein